MIPHSEEPLGMSRVLCEREREREREGEKGREGWGEEGERLFYHFPGE